MEPSLHLVLQSCNVHAHLGACHPFSNLPYLAKLSCTLLFKDKNTIDPVLTSPGARLCATGAGRRAASLLRLAPFVEQL